MWSPEYTALTFRIIVGVTFMISGAVKLYDIQEFSPKIQEYLSVLASRWSKHISIFMPYTLLLAIAVASTEVVLGAALLTQFYVYWTLIALLLLTIFFTGLTFYTAVFSTIDSCGCFGKAWTLSPWQSFMKSVVLLAMILVLLIHTGGTYHKLL